MRDWLPIKRCNQVALGIAAVALLAFVICHFLPYYEYPRYHWRYGVNPNIYSDRIPEYRGRFCEVLWANVFNPDYYIDIFRSPDGYGFLSIASNLALLMTSIAILAIVPFWRVLHASAYLRIPIALCNFTFAYLAIRISIAYQQSGHFPVSTATSFMLVGIVAAAVGAAMVIFENELGLRHELEVKRIMEEEKNR